MHEFRVLKDHGNDKLPTGRNNIIIFDVPKNFLTNDKIGEILEELVNFILLGRSYNLGIYLKYETEEPSITAFRNEVHGKNQIFLDGLQ